MKKNILSILCVAALMSYCANASAQLRDKVSNVGSSVSNTVSNIGSSMSNAVSNIEETMMEKLPPYKLGLTAGFNSSNFSADKFDPKSGFNLGVDLMLDASDLINNTYARINLLVQRKGTRTSIERLTTMSLVHVETKIRTVYLEIPVHYGYAYRLNRDWSLLGEMGPYIAFGLGGHYHISDVLGMNEENMPTSYLKFFSSDFNGQKPKRFDLGWGLAAGGMLWNQHQFMLKYDFGAVNMNDAFQQNRNFQITYSYFFE